MEYVTEGLPTTLTIGTMSVDIQHNMAGLPNKAEAKISFTYSRDIAKYVAKLLTLETWQRAYFVAGDVKTWNEIVTAAEVGKGVRFEVKYDSLESLRKGKVTELPGHARAYELFGALVSRRERCRCYRDCFRSMLCGRKRASLRMKDERC